MSDPEAMTYRAANHAELAAAFAEIQPRQREGVRKQLAGILLKYSAELGWEATFDRFNGRTVAEVLSAFTPAELLELQHEYSYHAPDRNRRGDSVVLG